MGIIMQAQGTAIVNTRTPRAAPNNQDQGTYHYKSPEQQALENGEITRQQLLEDVLNVPLEPHQIDAEQLLRYQYMKLGTAPVELATTQQDAFTGYGNIPSEQKPRRKLVKATSAQAGILLATEAVIHVLAAMTEEQKCAVLQWLANDLGYEM